MKVIRLNNCRVCGYYNQEMPWGIDNITPSYDICPCCGVEFGNEDYCMSSILNYRKDWIDNSMPWFDKKMKPENWNFDIQKKNIPDEWRNTN